MSKALKTVALAWAAAFMLLAAPRARAAAPEGLWYLTIDDARYSAQVGSGASPSVTLVPEAGGASGVVDEAGWDAARSTLSFRRALGSRWEWYRLRVEAGVASGRVSYFSTSAARPADDCPCYARHVTGWNSSELDRRLVPRSFELFLGAQYRFRLRIDSAPSGALVGRFKALWSASAGARGEGIEEDIEVNSWDGAEFQFTRRLAGGVGVQVFTGRVTGRLVAGSYTHPGVETPTALTGWRAEVLGYGLVTRPRSERAAWQARTRAALALLTAGGAPAPSWVETEVLDDFPLSPSEPLAPTRDDNPAAHPRAYRLSEVFFRFGVPTPWGEARREAHGFLATPYPQPAAAGAPAIVVVNGHGGSARHMMDATTPYYWYGDAFARRGFYVLALDVGHRPPAHRGPRPLYTDSGDCEAAGQYGLADCTHEGVVAPGFATSDWEEDGERAWDVSRAVDFLLDQPGVDPSRVYVTGHSLGGEVAQAVGALEPRLAGVIASGYFPDMAALRHGVSHNCWRWNHGDISEYVDLSDLQALVAPRLFVQTVGRSDDLYSKAHPSFAASKQIARRARAAYGDDAGRYFFYLPQEVHYYRLGDFNPSRPAAERGVRQPLLLSPPPMPGWQSDAQTTLVAGSVFDLLGCPAR